jgi:hypothetical protein
MRGIGPEAAATVLRRCAEGMAPQDAWALAAQELKNLAYNMRRLVQLQRLAMAGSG